MYPGAVTIAEEYGRTPAGNLARYIAGVSYLYLNDFDNAIEYLKDYKKKDELIGAMSHMALGDAYMEKGRVDNAMYEKGLEQYKKAAELTENEFVAPKILFKLARAYEYFDKGDQAVEQYELIINKYPLSDEGPIAEKHLAKIQAEAV
jgi:tetratricopeptide (TPR) repeat protein